jgi:cobalt-zinc-cadmium efflux system protein
MSHAHSHDGHSHGLGQVHGDTSNKTRVLIAAALTGGFMVAEAVGGVLTGSLALLADAGHMLTDSVSLVLAWYAFHLAARAASARMTYGYDRVKTLVAYTNALTVFIIALWILYEAWQRISDPAPVLGGPMLIIASLGLLVNIAAFFVLNGGDSDSLNMRGAILHVLGDLLGSVAAIVAAVVILYTGWTPIDPILSVLVAVLLFRSSWALMRESGALLLEGVPGALDRDAIAADLVASVPGVREVHHMHVWSLDGEKNMATLHACLKDGADPYATVSNIKKRLASKHGIAHATVEPEFGVCADHQDDEHDHADHDHGDHDHHHHDHSGAHAGHKH